MAHSAMPHFANDTGADVIRVGARRFMCIGARPPFDHPHVFLDMGDESELVCPYCSTLYRYDATFGPTQSEPEACLWEAA